MLKETNGHLSTCKSEISLKISSLLSEIDICLIWSRGLSADLHRRPMTHKYGSIESGLWFFLPADFHIVEFYRDSPVVTVAVSNPTTKKCAALAGRATISSDKQTMSHFSADKKAAILPPGIQHTSLVLLKIEIDQMDFWEWPDGTLMHSTFKMESLRSEPDHHWTHDVQWSSYCQ